MHGDYWNVTNGAAITTATWIGVQNATDAAFLCVAILRNVLHWGHFSIFERVVFEFTAFLLDNIRHGPCRID